MCITDILLDFKLHLSTRWDVRWTRSNLLKHTRSNRIRKNGSQETRLIFDPRRHDFDNTYRMESVRQVLLSVRSHFLRRSYRQVWSIWKGRYRRKQVCDILSDSKQCDCLTGKTLMKLFRLDTIGVDFGNKLI